MTEFQKRRQKNSTSVWGLLEKVLPLKYTPAPHNIRQENTKKETAMKTSFVTFLLTVLNLNLLGPMGSDKENFMVSWAQIYGKMKSNN